MENLPGATVAILRATVVSLLCALFLYLANAQAEFSLPVEKAARSLLLDVCSAGTRLLAVGERGHIIFSDDAGKSWTQARVPATAMLTAVSFVTPQRGWAVGHDGIILHSVDAGAHWQVQRNGLTDVLEKSQHDWQAASRHLRALRPGNEDLADTDNAREQLAAAEEALERARENLELAPAAPPLLDLWFTDEETGWAVGAAGSLLMTNDGGRHWIDRSDRIHNPDLLHLNAIVGSGDGHLWIAGEMGTVYRSDNEGENWVRLEFPYQGSLFGALYDERLQLLLLFGLRGSAYASTDDGNHWQAVDTATDASLAGGTIAKDGTMSLVGNVGAIISKAKGQPQFYPQRAAINRQHLSAIAETHDGHYVVVGESGVQRLALRRAAEKNYALSGGGSPHSTGGDHAGQ